MTRRPSRRKHAVLASIAGVLLISASVVASAATPAAKPPPPQIPSTFTNLEILPEEITRAELLRIMRDFAGALDVRCQHCHVGEDPSLADFDFAADDKEPKRVARAMLRMVEEINRELLPTTGRPPAELTEVQCFTCHRGITDPRRLSEILIAETSDEGVEAAVRTYRDLREQYHGRAVYDFGLQTLNRAAEDLAASGAVEEAVRLLQLNLEYHPGTDTIWFAQAQVLARADEIERAIEALEHAIELAPETAFYKQALEQLRNRR